MVSRLEGIRWTGQIRSVEISEDVRGQTTNEHGQEENHLLVSPRDLKVTR